MHSRFSQVQSDIFFDREVKGERTASSSDLLLPSRPSCVIFVQNFYFCCKLTSYIHFYLFFSIRNMRDSLYPSLNDPPPPTHTHYYFILQHYPIFFSLKHLKPALCDFGRLFLIFFSGKVFRVFPIFVRMLVCLLYTVCKVIYLEKLIDSNTQQKHQIEHLQKELKIFLLWFILQTRNQFFSNSNLGGTQWCSG